MGDYRVGDGALMNDGASSLKAEVNHLCVAA